MPDGCAGPDNGSSVSHVNRRRRFTTHLIEKGRPRGLEEGMSKRTKTPALIVPGSTRESRAATDAHRRSGAAGVHSDQKAKRRGALNGNRQTTRSSIRRAAIADYR